MNREQCLIAITKELQLYNKVSTHTMGNIADIIDKYADHKVNELNKPDVNESLALAGLFRQVSVLERLPSKSGIYFIVDPNGFRGNSKCSARFSLSNESWHDGSDSLHPIYWLEEVELPSDEDIEKEFNISNGEFRQFNKAQHDRREGAKWMLNLVLAGKAVTAKDNVR